MNLTRRVLALLVTAAAAVPLVLTPPAAADPAGPQVTGWSPTGKLTVARELGAGVLLNDGRVMVLGGFTCDVGCTYNSSTEFYDPTTGTWSPGPSMSTPRANLEAVVLGDGRVLAIGGSGGDTSGTTAEVYDPSSGAFSSAGSFGLAGQRGYGFKAVTLVSGKVLVVGGASGGPSNNRNTIIYNPAANLWARGPNLSVSRDSPMATLLPDGKVLVAGGSANHFTPMASTELYDPDTNSMSPGPSMFDARAGAESALMPDGRVLIVGGTGAGQCLRTSEVYSPIRNSFVDHRPVQRDRSDETANPVLTNDGSMLTAAGDCSTRNSQLYDGATATWSVPVNTVYAHRNHVLLRLRSGYVLAAGGANHKTAELFEPTTLATAYATPNPVVRGTPVTIAGTGFVADESIQLTYNGVLFATATADGNGEFSVSVATDNFAPRAYITLATGVASGRTSYFSAPVVAG